MKKSGRLVLLIETGLDRLCIPSYIGMMTLDAGEKRKSIWGWGVSASLFIHAVLAFVILVGMPFDFPKVEEEQTVNVEIVPPPEQAKSEQDATEAVPKPPEQEKPEETPSSEQAARLPAELPAPPAEDTSNAQQQASGGQPLNSFRPVFQFGERDAGPKKTLDGDGAPASEVAEEPTDVDKSEVDDALQRPEATEQNEVKVEEEPERLADASLEAENQKNTDRPGEAVPEGITVPDVGSGAAVAGVSATGEAAADSDRLAAAITTEPPKNSKATNEEAAKVADADGAEGPSDLKEAKRLFSAKATDNPMAEIAMGSMSAGERAAELCNTELREQLRRGSPAYSPDVLPKPRLTGDHVIDVHAIGFRARSQWYDVSFRCEVDKGATKVVSFAYKVGGAIPKAEWRKRRFPAY